MGLDDLQYPKRFAGGQKQIYDLIKAVETDHAVLALLKLKHELFAVVGFQIIHGIGGRRLYRWDAISHVFSFFVDEAGGEADMRMRQRESDDIGPLRDDDNIPVRPQW